MVSTYTDLLINGIAWMGGMIRSLTDWIANIFGYAFVSDILLLLLAFIAARSLLSWKTFKGLIALTIVTVLLYIILRGI